MAGLCAPLSTLRQYPRGYLRMTRGRCGSLLLHRDGLAPSTPCRSPGALRSTPIKGHRQTGQSLIAAVFFGLALCGAVISTASARSRWLLSAVQSRRNRGSAADSHPADSPAMAVPETLCHPFATAKIVVWPGTCSVRGGHMIAARSCDACGDATLCACRRRGERTSNRCDRDEGSKCLLHSRPSCACLACGHATAAPPQDTKKFPPLHVNPPAGHRIRSTECIDRGWLRVAYLQSPDGRGRDEDFSSPPHRSRRALLTHRAPPSGQTLCDERFSHVHRPTRSHNSDRRGISARGGWLNLPRRDFHLLFFASFPGALRVGSNREELTASICFCALPSNWDV